MKTLLKALLAILIVTAAMSAEKPAPSSPAQTPVKKKIYELPKTGLNQARPGGGWINAEIVGTRLVIKFFDKEKKPVSPDVEHGFARFNYAAKNDKTAVLGRDANTLATPATVRPPHNFLVILSLFASESAGPTESYTFKYP